MKYLTVGALLTFGLFIGGCAQEAFYVDREHGVASSNAFDQQIVNKDYKYANKDVEGLDAIYAEDIMGKYSATYKSGFTKEDIDIQQFQGSSK